MTEPVPWFTPPPRTEDVLADHSIEVTAIPSETVPGDLTQVYVMQAAPTATTAPGVTTTGAVLDSASPAPVSTPAAPSMYAAQVPDPRTFPPQPPDYSIQPVPEPEPVPDADDAEDADGFSAPH